MITTAILTINFAAFVYLIIIFKFYFTVRPNIREYLLKNYPSTKETPVYLRFYETVKPLDDGDNTDGEDDEVKSVASGMDQEYEARMSYKEMVYRLLIKAIVF